MRRLDMSPYRPYRRMGQTCQTRTIRDKQVIWVKPEPEYILNNRFLLRPLRRGDIEAAAELWRWAYPEIYGSEHDFILYPEEYERRVTLEESWELDSREKRYCILTAEEVASGRLAAATMMTKYDKNLQIEYTFAGTHPDYRQQRLMGFLGRVMDRMIRVSGAEYLTTFLETWHTITQDVTLKWGRGWKIGGIFPGNFTRWTGDQEEYRACEIYLYKFINDGDKYATQPEEWHLHPEIQRLWEMLETINAKLG
ncbi:MAG: hypothetical protein DRG58_01440 [Deltaproteobacteria bacterium]|nr:MAG: hypothetical protein DRG58_01440 [Deltaproteobacteria bacterium]